jgi:osmotically-inducible protein OsmY
MGSSIEMWLASGEEHATEVALQRGIWKEFGREALLANTDLSVEVADRRAVLDGTVETYLAKATAGRTAARVEGLRAVENRIQVHPRAAHLQTDADLAAAVRRALAWSAIAAPREPITVEVESGVVTLCGEVSRPNARLAAEDVVSHVEGVTDVRNEIAVRP